VANSLGSRDMGEDSSRQANGTARERNKEHPSRVRFGLDGVPGIR